MTSTKPALQTKCTVCRGGVAELQVNGSRYCKGCWDEKHDLATECRHQLNLSRIYRGADVERYPIFPQKGQPALGEIIAIRERPEFTDIVAVIDTRFDIDATAYQLEGDPSAPETRTDVLADALVGEVIEPWGGGKWLLSIHRGDSAGEQTYEGEI